MWAWGLGFRVWGLGFWVLGSGFRLEKLRVQGFRGVGIGFQVLGLGRSRGSFGHIALRANLKLTDAGLGVIFATLNPEIT